MIPVNHMSHQFFLFFFCRARPFKLRKHSQTFPLPYYTNQFMKGFVHIHGGILGTGFNISYLEMTKEQSQSLSQFLSVRQQPWLCARAGPLSSNASSQTCRRTAVIVDPFNLTSKESHMTPLIKILSSQ